MAEKEYVVVLQCDIVKERCSGYFCEKAFTERNQGFTDLPGNTEYRFLTMTCGGCCGLATHRKLSHLLRKLKKDGIEKDQLIVHLASCICKDNYHGPPCPHIDYLKVLICEKLGLDIVEGTSFSKVATKKRKEGTYKD